MASRTEVGDLATWYSDDSSEALGQNDGPPKFYGAVPVIVRAFG